MAQSPRETVEAYLDAWTGNDFDGMRGLLRDDLRFSGPIDEFSAADPLIEALRGLSQIKQGIEVQRTWEDGADVLVWYMLSTVVAPPTPIAEWYRVGDDGLISDIRVVFDAGPFAPPDAG